MDESLKADVIYWAAFYERRMRVGNKKIFHLEAWVVKVMSLYKVMYMFSLSVRERSGDFLDPNVFIVSGALLMICILFLDSIISLMWTWRI